MRAEAVLQREVCRYIQDNYPDVLFHSDVAAGMPLQPWVAKFNQELQVARGLPDVYIFEPVNGFHGLFIELKTLESSSVKKDGTVGNDKHVLEQRIVHQKFTEKGYLTDFSVGLENTKKLIDDYISGKFYPHEHHRTNRRNS